MLPLIAACAPDPAAPPPRRTQAPVPVTEPAVECAPRDVLVVVLDDVGVDAIGAYGAHPTPPRTPTLDALAADGLRFDRAYATPVCSSTRAALLSGRHGRRTGIGTNLYVDRPAYQGALPLGETTFAEVARDAGYRTGAFGKWHLATGTIPGVERHPNDQGFERFAGTLGNLDEALDGLGGDYFAWEELADGVTASRTGYAPTATVDAALAWLAGTEGPRLAYVAIHLGHGPLHVPPASLQGTGVEEGASEPELFAAMVEAADTELGRLLDGLPDPETTVLVVGDNGANLNNVPEPWDVQGGKGSVAEGGVRVPLLVQGPLVTPGASDAIVSVADVLPTVAALACADVSDLVLDGRSLLAGADPPFVYTELFGTPGPPPYSFDRRAVIERDWKLVRDVAEGWETVHEVGRSPEDETADLLADGAVPADVLARLRAEMDAMDASLGYGP